MPALKKGKKGDYYVAYSCHHPAKGGMVRFRHYAGFNSCTNELEVHRHAQKLIKAIGDKLTAGWRPWDGDAMLYSDQVEYHHVNQAIGSQRLDKNHLRKQVSEFLEWKKCDITAKSYSSYVSKIRLFCMWLENNGHLNVRVGEISNEVVARFFIYLINEKQLDKRTVGKYKQNLHQMFKYFKDKKLIKDIPLEHLPRAIKRVDNAARPITDDDIKRFLNFVAKNDRQLLLASVFQLLTLVRPNRELRLLKVQDLDLARGIVYIKDDTAKTTKRVVVMPDALKVLVEAEKITDYPATYFIFGQGRKPGPKPVGVNYFNRKFCEVKKMLMLSDNYKFYSFKHTGAGKLMESGATLAELMSHLGHVKFESTIHYVKRHFGEKSEKLVNFKPDFLIGI